CCITKPLDLQRNVVMVLRTLISAAVLFAPLLCHPQTTAVDSLKHLTTTVTNDTTRVHLLNALSFNLSDNDLNDAFAHARDAYALASTLKDSHSQAVAAQHLSSLSFRRGELGTSFQYATEGLTISQKLGDRS